MEHQYDIMDTIKSGSYGSVFRVKHRRTGEIRAVKKLYHFVSTSEAMEEVRMLTLLNSLDVDGFVAKFHGTYEDQGSQHLVFDMMLNDLETWVQSTYPKGVPLEPLKILSKKMLEAFRFLASHDIVHGDIKPNNLLMASSEPASLRVCDFGQARVCPFNGTGMVFPRSTAVASFRAPEVILGYPTRRPQSLDMWAVGCVLMEVILNESFFSPYRCATSDDSRGDDVLYQQCAAVCKPPPHMLEGSGETELATELKQSKQYPEYKSCKPLLHRLVDQLHKKRCNRRQEVIYLYDFIRRFLTMDPDDRVAPTVALTHAFLTRMHEL